MMMLLTNSYLLCVIVAEFLLKKKITQHLTTVKQFFSNGDQGMSKNESEKGD